jgi:cytochrome b involved in lipid metabolism
MVKLGEFTLAEVGQRNGKDGAETWIVIKDGVYNMSQFLKEVGFLILYYGQLIILLKLQHPGGPDLIQEYAGKDATKAFKEAGHSGDASVMLKNYKIGNLIPTEVPSRKGEKVKTRKFRSLIFCG